MIKVFWVEDEFVVREGIKNSIDWKLYGYEFCGEASDGEMAFPMIQELKPDIVITDIRMPFMDGLALSSLISRELPNTKIIIISGYGDFEYARQAIHIGVEQYLLKPITKAALIKALGEVREKIQAEREQKNYLEKFRSEMQEYEQLSRRHFFEQIVSGQLSVEKIYEKAGQLNIALDAQCYNLVLYSIESGTDMAWAKNDTADISTVVRDNLMQFFVPRSEYLLFRWNLTTCAVLIKGTLEAIDQLTERCVEAVRMQLEPFEKAIKWHVAVGTGTERLSGLPACFENLSYIFSHRHLMADQHILTKENTEYLFTREDGSGLENLDMTKIDPEIVRGFLQNGQPEEIHNFVEEYLNSLRDAVASKMFNQYLMLNVRFTVISYITELGASQQEAQEMLPGVQEIARNMSPEETKNYISRMLESALELREQKAMSQGHNLIRQAVEYIDRNFTDENISLKEVAGCINVSANYFSAVFSQEMKQTFVEYLTGKRMERAKELLRRTDKRSAEIAAEVGYKDPHYFSFVFRKTQGCSPRDYRTGGKRG